MPIIFQIFPSPSKPSLNVFSLPTLTYAENWVKFAEGSKIMAQSEEAEATAAVHVLVWRWDTASTPSAICPPVSRDCVTPALLC